MRYSPNMCSKTTQRVAQFGQQGSYTVVESWPKITQVILAELGRKQICIYEHGRRRNGGCIKPPHTWGLSGRWEMLAPSEREISMCGRVNVPRRNRVGIDPPPTSREEFKIWLLYVIWASRRRMRRAGVAVQRFHPMNTRAGPN